MNKLKNKAKQIVSDNTLARKERIAEKIEKEIIKECKKSLENNDLKGYRGGEIIADWFLENTPVKGTTIFLEQWSSWYTVSADNDAFANNVLELFAHLAAMFLYDEVSNE